MTLTDHELDRINEMVTAAEAGSFHDVAIVQRILARDGRSLLNALCDRPSRDSVDAILAQITYGRGPKFSDIDPRALAAYLSRGCVTSPAVAPSEGVGGEQLHRHGI